MRTSAPGFYSQNQKKKRKKIKSDQVFGFSTLVSGYDQKILLEHKQNDIKIRNRTENSGNSDLITQQQT